ncbi:hypothetical protein L1887_59328 [Cichorium endivia]|nr:hypothetical protein L1887_59328 [Cichorium endivia]
MAMPFIERFRRQNKARRTRLILGVAWARAPQIAFRGENSEIAASDGLSELLRPALSVQRVCEQAQSHPEVHIILTSSIDSGMPLNRPSCSAFRVHGFKQGLHVRFIFFHQSN